MAPSRKIRTRRRRRRREEVEEEGVAYLLVYLYTEAAVQVISCC